MYAKMSGDEESIAYHIRKGLRDRFLLMLACAAGSVDALSLMGLGGVFCSALSGNTMFPGP